ncbi:hypothetical protein [Photobacterium damselae]
MFCNDHDLALTRDSGANVYAWVDFNADCDFADSGEFTQVSCTDTDAGNRWFGIAQLLIN